MMLRSQLRIQNGAVLSLAWHFSGDCFATGSLNSTIRVSSLERPAAASMLRGHKGGVNSVQFQPTGHLLLSSSSDRRVLLWDARTVGSSPCAVGHFNAYSCLLQGRRELQLLKHEAPVTCARFLTNEQRIISSDDDGVVVLWDSRKADQPDLLSSQMFFGHGRRHIVVTPDDHYAISANTDGTMSIIPTTPNASKESLFI